MAAHLLAANWHGSRCGHNFEIRGCPYDGCEARENATAVDALRQSLHHAGPAEPSNKYWQIILSFDNGASVKDFLAAFSKVRGETV